MVEFTKGFGDTARSLARNPLGIIALFIVLVYSLAALVTSLASSLAVTERLPLIYFLVLFPVLVLAIFTWLVIRHPGVLFGPADFKNEDNYMEIMRGRLVAVANLATATAKTEISEREPDLYRLIDTVQRASAHDAKVDTDWKTHVLWVDDRPENNTFTKRAFEAIGLRFTVALSTAEALSVLRDMRFGAIISDMGRKEGSREGYALLDAIRAQGDTTPFFIYAGSNAPEHKLEAEQHGGQGSTNNPQDLFQMVTSAILKRR